MPQPEEPLILASASPRRRELLALLGIDFVVIPAEVEEPAPSRTNSPVRFAEELAFQKAEEVARRHPDHWVLGADTVVALGTALLGKPESPEAARALLRRLSGQTHLVTTGFALARWSQAWGLESEVGSASTRVRMRRLAPEEIEAYVETGEPMDKAGAYAIQGAAAAFIVGIRGDYPNVVGLPLAPLVPLLRARGFRVLGRP